MSKSIVLSSGWAQVDLGQVLKTSKEKCNPTEEKDCPYIGLEHIEKDLGKLLDHGRSGEVRSTKSVFRKGDLLYGKLRPYLNKVCIPDFDGVCSTDILVFPINECVSNYFLLYRLLSKDFVRYANQSVTGVQHPRVNFKQLSLFPINLPPVNEQQRIVTKIEQLFSDLDAGVKVLREIRKQIRQYRQSVLKYAFEGKLTAEWRRKNKGKIEPASKLLERIAQEKAQKTKGKKHDKLPPLDSSGLPTLPEGWEYYPLDEFVESMKNGIYKPKEYYADEGTACLRMYNIEEGNIVWKDIKRMTLTKQEIEEYGLVPGDLLINRVNSRELVGKTAVIPENMEMCVYESKNIRLRLLSKSVRPQYIGYWFLFYAHRYFNSNAQQVVGMASINQTQICQMPIPICSYLEQEKIVTEIDRNYSIADKLDQIIDSAEKQSNRLRQSILNRAFEGGLVPQDPHDEPAEILLKKIQEQRITSPTTDRRTIVRSARKTKGKKGS